MLNRRAGNTADKSALRVIHGANECNDQHGNACGNITIGMYIVNEKSAIEDYAVKIFISRGKHAHGNNRGGDAESQRQGDENDDDDDDNDSTMRRQRQTKTCRRVAKQRIAERQ